jgi:hypothetical protein
MMIFRFKGLRMSFGENDLAASLVAINNLNKRLQHASADGRKQKELHEIATQIMLECSVIREVTVPPVIKVKPGLLSRWFNKKE